MPANRRMRSLDKLKNEACNANNIPLNSAVATQSGGSQTFAKFKSLFSSQPYAKHGNAYEKLANEPGRTPDALKEYHGVAEHVLKDSNASRLQHGSIAWAHATCRDVYTEFAEKQAAEIHMLENAESIIVEGLKVLASDKSSTDGANRIILRRAEYASKLIISGQSNRQSTICDKRPIRAGGHKVLSADLLASAFVVRHMAEDRHTAARHMVKAETDSELQDHQDSSDHESLLSERPEDFQVQAALTHLEKHYPDIRLATEQYVTELQRLHALGPSKDTNTQKKAARRDQKEKQQDLNLMRGILFTIVKHDERIYDNPSKIATDHQAHGSGSTSHDGSTAENGGLSHQHWTATKAHMLFSRCVAPGYLR